MGKGRPSGSTEEKAKVLNKSIPDIRKHPCYVKKSSVATNDSGEKCTTRKMTVEEGIKCREVIISLFRNDLKDAIIKGNVAVIKSKECKIKELEEELLLFKNNNNL